MSTNPNALSMPTSTAQAAAAQSPTTRKAIASNFRELTKDPKKLDEAANQLYESLLEDAVTGIFIEVHHLRKTGNLSALDGVPEESTHRICEVPNLDIFGVSTAKKAIDCTCPNCDRLVAAARFAPHLEKCMGMGRISSRIASRRLATKEGSSASSNSSYVHSGANTGGTDDEDDVDWSSDKRKKKSTQNSRNNGSKKNNGKTF